MSGLGSLFGGLFSRWSAAAGDVVTPPAPTVTPRPAGVPNNRAEAVARYGEIKDSVWSDEAKWMTQVELPGAVAALWLLDGKTPIKHIGCNKDIAGMLEQAMKNLIARGLVGELKSYDGCLNIRNTRGSSLISAHAYGCAIDLNCDTNPLGQEKPSYSDGFKECWTDAGFTCGADFRGRKDPMHFSAVGF